MHIKKCAEDGMMNGMRWFADTAGEVIEFPVDRIVSVLFDPRRSELIKQRLKQEKGGGN